MKYVFIGKLVNTHGLKGEVRILSNFKFKDKVFVPGMNIYIGKDKTCEEIVSYRHHKIFEMIMMKGYNDIDEVLKYKGEYVFVNREDIKLSDNEYLDEDIIGCNVLFNDKLLGKVIRIDNHNGNYVLVIRGEREYLIPYVMIDKVDIKKKEIITKDITGLV
jgi:16S rRNA processing protein RimM